MLLSQLPRTHYAKAPVHEVICQLRFPTILSINSADPAEFQDRIRTILPQYAKKEERPLPKPGQPQSAELIHNYHFLSADGKWKLNLTRDFIALSTLSYPGWEPFARMLDKPLAAFIQLYKPACFQRIGLRYLNIISRKALQAEDACWRDLIAPAYLGALAEADVEEERLLSGGVDTQLKLDSSCTARIHAGTGRLKNNAPGAVQDPEVKFIFDMDLAMGGSTPCNLASAGLETLHGHSTRLFEGAITDRLRKAMDRV